MKTLFLTFVLLTFTIAAIGQKTEFKRYQLKSGIAQYVHEGNVTGTETVWFDDYGEKEFRTTQTETKILGMKQKSNSCTLNLGFDTYQWDPATKKGTHVRNTLMEEYLKDPDFDMEEFARKLMESTGFKKTGEATLDGKSCEVWEGLNSKVWVWKTNGMAIRTEVNLIISAVVKLTELNANASIPANKFAIPSDVKFKEEKMPTMEEIQKQMEQENDAAEPNQGDSADTAEPVPNLKNILKQFKKK